MRYAQVPQQDHVHKFRARVLYIQADGALYTPLNFITSYPCLPPTCTACPWKPCSSQPGHFRRHHPSYCPSPLLVVGSIANIAPVPLAVASFAATCLPLTRVSFVTSFPSAFWPPRPLAENTKASCTWRPMSESIRLAFSHINRAFSYASLEPSKSLSFFLAFPMFSSKPTWLSFSPEWLFRMLPRLRRNPS